MKTACKSIITIVLVSLLVSLMSISIVKAQDEPYSFIETWNYDGIHPLVNTGDSWEHVYTEFCDWWYYVTFSITNQDLYADHHWKWSTYATLCQYGSDFCFGEPPPGDYGTASYSFSQSSGNISVNATSHAHIVAQGDYTGWPHFNVAQCYHTLELGYVGSFGNKVTIKLENASAGISGTPPIPEGYGGHAAVRLTMKCSFQIKTLISRNPDTYSVEYNME